MSSSKGPRSVDAESMPVIVRSTSNRQSKELQQRQQARKKGDTNQEPWSVKERLKCCIPTDPYTLLFGTVMIICTVVGVFDFFRTDNTAMLITLCSIVAGHTGIQKVKTLLPKKREPSPEEPETE